MTDSSAEASQRSTEFIATISWDEDSEWEDVIGVTLSMKQMGYGTRMAADNSEMLVFRDG
jgi:hypothetical protein